MKHMDYEKKDMNYGKGNGGHKPVAEAGFKCVEKFPLTGGKLTTTGINGGDGNTK
ncbi:MAG: hypothetical protein ACE5IR_24245 [bacterium]